MAWHGLKPVRNEHDGAPVAGAGELRHQRAELPQEPDSQRPVQLRDCLRLLRRALNAGCAFYFEDVIHVGEIAGIARLGQIAAESLHLRLEPALLAVEEELLETLALKNCE